MPKVPIPTGLQGSRPGTKVLVCNSHSNTIVVSGMFHFFGPSSLVAQ